VPTIVALNVVYVPVLDNVNAFKFSVVVPGLKDVVPQLSKLNQLPVVIVATLAPVVNVKFGALVVEPPVVPNVNVLVTAMSATVNPPVPVYVNPVAMAILNTTVARVVCVRLMFPVLNVIDLVLVLVDANIPVANVNPANANVPAVNVVVPVATKDKASAKVVVPALLIVNAAIVLVTEVIVPVPTMVAVNAVYVPPLANVNEFKFSVVVAGVQVLPVKFNKLNQLPVVIVGIEAPVVNARLGALVVEPPVVPNVNVLVTDIAEVNPPVPVLVNPVAVAISRLVAAAVVVASIILLVPNVIALVLVLVELNVPVVKS